MSVIVRFISTTLFLAVPLFPAPLFKASAPLTLPLGSARSYAPKPGGGLGDPGASGHLPFLRGSPDLR